jgi:hypothetical protein
MERSESIIELSKALATFHSKVGKIKRDSKNPFFKSKYASISNILDEIGEPLLESGLVITQFPDENGLVSLLIHAETGQFISSNYQMPVAKANDPQALGSSITYARRYAITSILSLNVEDDDGNKGAEPPKEPKEPELPWLNKGEQLDKAMDYLRKGGNLATIEAKYKLSKEIKQNLNEVIKGLA